MKVLEFCKIIQPKIILSTQAGIWATTSGMNVLLS